MNRHKFVYFKHVLILQNSEETSFVITLLLLALTILQERAGPSLLQTQQTRKVKTNIFDNSWALAEDKLKIKVLRLASFPASNACYTQQALWKLWDGCSKRCTGILDSTTSWAISNGLIEFLYQPSLSFCFLWPRTQSHVNAHLIFYFWVTSAVLICSTIQYKW